MAVCLASLLLLGRVWTGAEPYDAGKDAPAARARPNVVVFLTDDQQASTLRAMPAVQRELVGRGRTFENTVSALPLCCPGRATLQTGKYPHNTGVYENNPPHGGWPRFAEGGHDRSTAAVWLRDAGYRTGYLGRYMHHYDGSSTPPGFDLFNAEVEPPAANEPGATFTNTLGQEAPLPVPEGGTVDSVVGKRTVNVVRDWAPREEPFFLQVGFEAPHAPAYHEDRDAGLFRGRGVPRTPAWNEQDVSDKPGWVREKPPLEQQKIRQAGEFCRGKHASATGQADCLYRNMLRSLQTVDRTVAGVTGALAEAGELDNTYLLFYTDNGLHLGEHRLAYGKLTPYGTDTGFPLIARGPGISPGSASDKLVGNHDVAPTLADIAGVEAPGADGRSFLPVATGDPDDWRTALYSERRVFPDQGPLKGGVQDVPAWEAVRTERFSYVEYATGERELYDLGTDPHETDSLNTDPEYAGLMADLSARLNVLRTCSGESCRAAEGPG